MIRTVSEDPIHFKRYIVFQNSTTFDYILETENLWDNQGHDLYLDDHSVYRACQRPTHHSFTGQSYISFDQFLNPLPVIMAMFCMDFVSLAWYKWTLLVSWYWEKFWSKQIFLGICHSDCSCNLSCSLTLWEWGICVDLKVGLMNGVCLGRLITLPGRKESGLKLTEMDGFPSRHDLFRGKQAMFAPAWYVGLHSHDGHYLTLFPCVILPC